MSAPIRWREIEQVVATALDLPAGERDGYVDSVCGSDTPLSTEVRALIRAYEQAGDFLDHITYQGKWSGAESEAGALDGKLAGQYRLVHVLGRGGMGVVYLGRRDDDQFQKDVAVKLMSPALHSPGLMRRFRDERQILASLEHPNIARLFDAGVTADGIPFIVMEYVAGEPIHHYCRDKGLGVRDRLALFVKICGAVHYAHKNLVVHRDLKPSNILVTPEGVPKLLDFGIAKMLSVTGTGSATAPMTQALTPDYASPEQIRGGNLTTASDVYSLGVLLYELLAGERPYVLSGKPIDEMLRTVCEQEPERVSVAAARQSTRIAKELCGDLDHIVAKSLRKEASERYGSAEELAADIERHLNGLPVEARRGSVRYKAGKYLRRYKAAFVFATLALLLASAGVAAIILQARIAERERAVAQRRFNEVRQLARSVIFELHDGVAPLPGSLPVRKLLVTRALEFLNTLAREAGGDRGLTLELAEAFVRIGELQGGFTMSSFGDLSAARTSLLKAQELLAPIHHADASDPPVGLLMGRIYHRLSGVSVGLRDFPAALDYCIRTDETFTAVLRAHPDNDRAATGLAAAYFARAVILGLKDNNPLSEYWQKSLGIYKTVIERGSREPDLDRNYARSLTFYGSRLSTAGRNREALAVLQQAHAINEKRLATAPSDAETATNLIDSYGQQAGILHLLGRDEEALQLYRKALSVALQLSEASPQDIYLRDSSAVYHEHLGEQLMEMKRFDEALVNFRAAIRIEDDLAARTPPVSYSNSTRMNSWLNAGRIEQRNGRRFAACQDYRRAAAVYAGLAKSGSLRKSEKQIGTDAVKAAESCPPKS